MACILRRGYSAVFFLIVGTLQVVGAGQKSVSIGTDDDPRCKPHVTTQTFSVGTNNLYELHLRHNIKGSVTVTRSDYSTRDVKISVKKTVITREKMDGFIINQTKPGSGRGHVFVLQLDYQEPSRKVVKVVIGGIITAITLLILFAIAIWCWVSRRRHQEFQLVRNNRGSSDKRKATSSSDPHPEELQETEVKTSNVNRVHHRGTPVLLPPPPARAPVETNHSPSKPERSGPAGLAGTVGTPRGGFPKSPVVALALVTVVSVVYANCLIDPQLDVTIHIPDDIPLHGVKLFLNSEFQIPVYTNGWAQWNKTDSQVFDIRDASKIDVPPCFAEDVCGSSGGYKQKLVGCEPETRQCLCPRGYTMEHGVCYDKDECSLGEAKCPPGAICRNLQSSYACECRVGMFMGPAGCQACSEGCLPGFYEAVSCTQNTDRVCKECTACTGATYESGTCDGFSDNHCLHVAYPLVENAGETVPAWKDGMKVVHSSNVFLEDLHNTQSLDTTHYITDVKQAFDFYWDRESKLRVNIGILNVHLIPEFEDVEHESDNRYILNIPKESIEKDRIKHITDNYCRHPIPDYYKLTLETYRDRITRAKTIICDSKDSMKAKCPMTYRDGDRYIVRTRDEPCEKMGTYPVKLEVNSNSIVCTEQTAMLSTIFSQNFTYEQPISFPPKKCKNPQAQCSECFRKKRCINPDDFAKSCCRVECYAETYCKMAFSDRCTKAPEECSMGDAYRYTLQPMFDNIRTNNMFQCHLKYKKSKILYEMFYYISTPGSEERKTYSTPRMYRTVMSGDLDFQSYGQTQQDYITVTHDSGITMKQEDFIMVFRPEKKHSNKYNLTLHSMKNPDQFTQKKLTVMKINSNVHVTFVQFDKPFAYSTAIWQREGHWCDKDVSRFRAPQAMYQKDAQPVVADMNYKDSVYYLKSKRKPPMIKLHVPGNTSVLSWYFKDGAELLLDESLQAKLELTPEGGVWTISVSGVMSDCPAYLAITINDRTTKEELFRYDLLIMCPVEFSVSCKVPNFIFKRERVFEILLKDPHKEHTIYLNQLIMSSQGTLPEVSASTAVQDSSFDGWSIILIITISTVVVLWILFFLFVYLEFTKTSQVKNKESDVQLSLSGSNTTSRCYAGGQISREQFVFVVVYAIFRVIYSFLFTFTVFLAILLLLLRPDFTQISKLPEFQEQQHNATRNAEGLINAYRHNETLRQIRLATRMQTACNSYIQATFKQMQEEMYNITWKNQVEMYEQTTSISAHIVNLVNTQLSTYKLKITNFTQAYETKFIDITTPSFMRYRQFLNNIFHNGWLGFPLHLFNNSELAHDRPKAFNKSRFLSGPEANFLSYLGVQEIENVQLMPLKFWKRYSSKMPRVEDLELPKMNPTAPPCSFSREEAFEKLKSSEQEDRLASFRFFPMDPDSPYSKQHIRDGTTPLSDYYKYILPVEQSNEQTWPIFSVDEFVSSLNVRILQYVFLVLDAVLLVYRCTRTYSTILTLCRGFEEVVSVNETKLSDDQRQVETVNKVCESHSGSSLLEERTRGSCSKKLLVIDSPAVNHSPRVSRTLTVQNALGSGSHTDRGGTLSFSNRSELLLSLLARLFLTKVLSKLLIACIVGLVCYLVVTLTCHLVTTDLVYHYGGFSTFLAGLDVRLNHSNSFLAKQAQHLNDVTMDIYKQQMMSELQSLQSMMEHFNLEQEEIVNTYRLEACTVRRKLLGEFTECDLTVIPRRIMLQLLPCNFIPIATSPFTGYNKYKYVADLKSNFLPFVEAARNVVFKVLYASLSTLAIILLIHVSGCVLFHYLKTRHKFVVHQVYLSTLPPPGFMEGLIGGDDTDADSDDGFQGPPVRIQSSPLRSNKPETLTPDTGYSETKV